MDGIRRTQPSRVDRLAEITLAVLVLHILLLSVFRRYSLEAIGLPLSFNDPAVALSLVLLLVAGRVWTNRRRDAESLSRFGRLAPGHWLDRLNLPGFIITVSLLLVFSIFHYYGGRLGGDGVMNFIYVRSLVIDGDFDLTNEFADFVPSKFQHVAEAARAAGLPPDPTNEPGPALLWAPAFVLTHGLVLLSRAFGSGIPSDGYSYPYINAVSTMGFLWGFVAVVIAYIVARRYFDPRLAAVSVCLLWWSSTLYWYTVFEPSMPHATAAAAVSFFLYQWVKVRDQPSPKGWILLGVAGGLILSMQRYNVFFFVAPSVTVAEALLRSTRRLHGLSRRSLVTAAVVVGACLLTASPMLLYNLSHSRTLVRAGDLSGFTLRYWSHPRIGEFLFSSNHGLFSWTPVAFLAVLGLFLLIRKDGKLAATLLLTLAAGIYLLSSTWDWYAGYAFGSRRTTEAFLILALGFCSACEFLIRRPKLLAAAGATLLVGSNLLVADLLKRGEIPSMGTFSFSDAASRAARRFYRILGHPASVPANWIFARRYGLTPDRFDAIYGHREYHNVAIDVGDGQDQFFLGRGWSVAEATPDGRSYRWSSGVESTFLVPLFGPFDYRLSLTAEPSRHPKHSSQGVLVSVNGRAASRLQLIEGWQTAETIIPASYWKAGLNEIELEYAWTVEAGDVYGGDDTREIALKLERLDLRIVK